MLNRSPRNSSAAEPAPRVHFSSHATLPSRASEFTRPELLQRAFTHASFSGRVQDNYEQLECVGDAVLGLAMLSLLNRQYPNAFGRELAVKAEPLIRNAHLADVGAALSLLRHARHGLNGTEFHEQKGKMRAELVEALFGAIYLDAGFERAEEYARRLFGDMLSTLTVRQSPSVEPHLRAVTPQIAGRVADLLGHRFEDSRHLYVALLDRNAPDHASSLYIAVNRYETIGTAALRLGVARALVERDPDITPAEIKDRRESCTSASFLAERALVSGLMRPLRGELMRAQQEAALRASCRTLFGAAFLDGGMDAVQRGIERWLMPGQAKGVPQHSASALEGLQAPDFLGMQRIAAVPPMNGRKAVR